MRTSYLAIVMVCGLAACEAVDPPPILPFEAAELRSAAAFDLDAALDPDGRLLVEPEPFLEPTLSVEEAERFAPAYVRTWAPVFGRIWEEDRGAPIDFEGLRVLGVTYTAESPYGQLPEEVHRGVRNGFGPYHVVHLGSGSAVEMIVAVAAYATYMRIDERGVVRTSPVGGDEFLYTVLPVGTERTHASAEAALLRVHRELGVQAARPPRLVSPWNHLHPAASFWRVDLAQPVEVPGRAGVTARTVYVDRHGTVRFASSVQPDHVTRRLISAPDAEGRWDSIMVDVPVRPGEAVEFVGGLEGAS